METSKSRVLFKESAWSDSRNPCKRPLIPSGPRLGFFPMMSPRLIIAAQSGVVIGLLGLSFYQSRLLHQLRLEVDAALTAPDLAPSTNQRPVRLRLQQLPPINIRTQTRDLDWKSVESDDYTVYIENLRRIGCPEETIRDIIIADVNKLYDSKRRALEPPPADWTFWRHPDEEGSRDVSDAERLRMVHLAALERERHDLVNRLLGPAGAEAQFEALREDELRDRSLQFLPEEKRQALAEALARWRLQMDEASLATDDTERADRTAAAELALSEQMSSLLTPEEREQYEMRASPLAERLREQLRGFGASREEFEKLFRVERQFAQEVTAIEAGAAADPQAAERREAAEIERASKIKELLGTQRIAEYERSQDQDYQTLYGLAASHDVPTAVANQVWDMRRDVEQQTARVRENPLLTIEQKERALEAIRNETQTAIMEVLGEPLLEAYREEGGGWLDDLTSPGQLEGIQSLVPAPEQIEAIPPVGTQQAQLFPEP